MTSPIQDPSLFPDKAYEKKVFECILHNTDRGVVFTNRRNEIIYVNERFMDITGYRFEEIEGKTPKFMQSGIQSGRFYDQMKEEIEGKGYWKGNLWNRTKNGDIYLQELTIYALKNQQKEIEYFVGFIRKLSGQEGHVINYELQGELYDPLTKLPNRILFEKRLHSTLQLSKRNEHFVTLSLFQIQNFHHINSTYGLVFGNILLKRITSRMEKLIPVSSMLSRWEGTIFACVTEEHQGKEEVEEMIGQFAKALTEPYIINGISIDISVRFGIAIYHSSLGDMKPSHMLSCARKALIQAKKENELFRFYDGKMKDKGNFVVNEEAIVKGIEQGEFELYYQPLISLETDSLVGFEALIRWQHPQQGTISPGEFIPLAEKTGLINELGAFVFKEACRQQVIWAQAGHGDIKISVNLSMNQFKDDFLVHFIKETLKETGANPTSISIELTESSFTEDTENTILTLKQLSNLGLTIAIDDFGTGYSSLGYLIDFPIHIIKIDRSFINVLTSNEKIEAIVKAINTMAKSLNLKVVAEGIETKEQYDLVKQLQCHIVQGFYFDRPRRVKEIEERWLMAR